MGSRNRRHRDDLSAKSELRARMRLERLNIGQSARHRAEAQVCETVTAWIESNSVTTFALYAAMRGELSLASLYKPNGIEATGWALAFPRVVDATDLAFHRISEISQLQAGTLGILEPAPTSPQMDSTALELILVPGLAFDRRGARVGWGRGYYDRALAKRPAAVRIGIAFSNQVVDQLPTSVSDIDLDFLITEKQLLRCPGADRDRSMPPVELAQS